MIQNDHSALDQRTDPVDNQAQSLFCFPASFAQQRLWFLDQLNPGTGFYNVSFTLKMQGNLSRSALQQSLHALVARHETLRTTFAFHEGQTVQCVSTAVKVALPLLDINALPLEQREIVAHSLVNDEAQRPFDLRAGPLLRTLLIRLAPEEHLLVVTLHHIITDGWSEGILFGELAAGYEAAKHGLVLELSPLSLQYADYAVWQHKWARGSSLDRHLAYWKQQLTGAPVVLDFITDRPRMSEQQHRRATINQRFPTALRQQVSDVSRREGVTVFMTLLSVFAIVLGRISGLDDYLMGTAMAGRTKRGLERLIGLFVNTLPLRINLQGAPTGRQLLQRMRDVTLLAYEHQDAPFEKIVEVMQVGRDISRNPLIQVIFSLDNTPGEMPDFEGLTVEHVDDFVQTASFDLELFIVEEEGEFLLKLEYSTDLFSEESMQRLLRQYRTLLESLLSNLDLPIEDLPWLTDAEQHQIVDEWNATQVSYPLEQTLVELFTRQVQQRPDAIAVSSEQGLLSYGELDRRSTQLAHSLSSMGVTSEVPVGICIDRSPDLIIAILGVLKAGGAYLPLDVDAPPLRLRQLLENAHATYCLLQDRGKASLFPDAESIKPVYLRIWANDPAARVEVSLRPENLVSIYYTSGSTGQPKGVASTHRGWVNRMLWMQQKYQLQPGEAVLHKTTITFDDSAVEIFWPLSVGGRIAILAAGSHKDPQAILDATLCQQVSALHFVPSMLLLFLDLIESENSLYLRTLRHVISSGEALRPELFRLFRERLECELHNQWGATEVSIDSTEYTCDRADTLEEESISLGYPIANNQVYILDARLRPLPPGVAGDLYLAGIGLARGYLHDPVQTATSFLPHPFEPGKRVYKTGDRGYYRPDGSLMFLGRTDDQVKVRGQRVELGEIEAVLLEHPDVQNCAVVARRQANGYRLVGYVVPRSRMEVLQRDSRQFIEALHSFLRERLPAYMVPGRILPIEKLPMTTSGKIDRKLLPDPTEEYTELQAGYVAPTTPTEFEIAAIWQQTLGMTRVGIQDQFFDLGGHSLDATRVISSINRQLEVQLPLRALFENPTVARLACRVEEERTQNNQIQRLPLTRLPRQARYEASRAQERLWLEYQLDSEHAYGAVWALELEGDLKPALLEQALQGLIARHSMLRTSFVEQEGKLYQIVHDAIAFPYSYYDFSALSTIDQSTLLAQQATQLKLASFDLTRGPLFAIECYKLAEQRYRLLWSIHSIAFDSWSFGVLINDLSALYSLAKEEKVEADLPQPLQYRDYAFWQNQRLMVGELEAQKAYWQEQLTGYLPMAKLPADFEEPPVAVAASTYCFATIDQELVERLSALATSCGATLYMILLAGLKIWLARTLGQFDIAIGSPVSGRVRAELEEVFGTLWNPVVLRTDLSDNPTCLRVLSRVKDTVLGAFANQEYPFDLVLQDYRYQQGIHNALYSIVFFLQNASEFTLNFDGIAIQASLAERLADKGKVISDEADSPYDLHIEGYEVGKQIMLVALYNSRRFFGETVDRWFAEFISILDQMSAHPDQHLSQLTLFDPSDLDELFGKEE